MLSTHAPMLGTRTYFNGSNSDVSFGWWTPLGIAKAAERIALDHEVTDHFFGAVAPELFPVYAEIAFTDDDVNGGDDDNDVCTELADIIDAEIADAESYPVLGSTFDPDDLQWGFTVRTRF